MLCSLTVRIISVMPHMSGPVGATNMSQIFQSSQSRLEDGKDMNENNSKGVYGQDSETTSSTVEKIKTVWLVKEEVEIDIGGFFFVICVNTSQNGKQLSYNVITRQLQKDIPSNIKSPSMKLCGTLVHIVITRQNGKVI